MGLGVTGVIAVIPPRRGEHALSDLARRGVIDPTAYYTIYADRTERRYDAATVRKLYVRLERPQFYALFGDYETAINEPQLARYNRSFNGVKAEFHNETVSVNAFAADTPYNHRRQEIQGNGLTGPYALAVRNLVPNSERVSIETRDRLRSDRIIETRPLSRHIDYDIDYAAGTLRFREPGSTAVFGYPVNGETAPGSSGVTCDASAAQNAA